MQARLALNSWSSCLSLLDAGSIGIYTMINGDCSPYPSPCPHVYWRLCSACPHWLWLSTVPGYDPSWVSSLVPADICYCISFASLCSASLSQEAPHKSAAVSSLNLLSSSSPLITPLSFSLKKKLLILVSGYFAYVCMHASGICLVPTEARHWIPWNWSYTQLRASCLWYWELNWIREEQSVLLMQSHLSAHFMAFVCFERQYQYAA